uniref:Uncharacterized protein n=1 Tax=Glossina palpalis gambiensis TaxID=67801 RepID=A0A1B0BFQ9_9MUSC
MLHWPVSTYTIVVTSVPGARKVESVVEILELTQTQRNLVCYYFGDMGNVVWHTSYKLSLFNYIDYNNPVAVALIVVVVVVVDVVVNVAVSPECVSQQIYFNTDHHHHHCNHDHDHHYHHHHHHHHYHHYHHRQRHCHHSQYRAHNNITYDYINAYIDDMTAGCRNCQDECYSCTCSCKCNCTNTFSVTADIKPLK